MAVHRQQPVLVAPGDQGRHLDAVEIDDAARAVAHRVEDVVDDGAADRGARHHHGLLGRARGARAPSCRASRACGSRAGRAASRGARRRSRGRLHALEERMIRSTSVRSSSSQPPPGEIATTLRARPRLASSSASAPPSELPARCAVPTPRPSSSRLEVVGRLRERLGARRRGRPAVVAVQRRRDDLEARRQQPEHGQPAAPGGGEAVDQDQRLAGAGAVQGGGQLSHVPTLTPRARVALRFERRASREGVRAGRIDRWIDVPQAH